MNNVVPPSLTAEHLDPWRSNAIELTMADGTSRIGMLVALDRLKLSLRRPASAPSTYHVDEVRVADVVGVKRSPRVLPDSPKG